MKHWNKYSFIPQLVKHSSNVLYDGAHGKKSLRGLFSWAAKEVLLKHFRPGIEKRSDAVGERAGVEGT